MICKLKVGCRESIRERQHPRAETVGSIFRHRPKEVRVVLEPRDLGNYVERVCSGGTHCHPAVTRMVKDRGLKPLTSRPFWPPNSLWMPPKGQIYL